MWPQSSVNGSIFLRITPTEDTVSLAVVNELTVYAHPVGERLLVPCTKKMYFHVVAKCLFEFFNHDPVALIVGLGAGVKFPGTVH